METHFPTEPSPLLPVRYDHFYRCFDELLNWCAGGRRAGIFRNGVPSEGELLPYFTFELEAVRQWIALGSAESRC